SAPTMPLKRLNWKDTWNFQVLAASKSTSSLTYPSVRCSTVSHRSTSASSTNSVSAPHRLSIKAPTKNFSPEATRGAVLAFRLPVTVTRDDVLKFMEKAGPVVELQYPVFRSIPYRLFARCKYESAERASHAMMTLTGQMFHGESILVYRAEYWMEEGESMASPDSLRLPFSIRAEKDYSPEAIRGAVLVFCIPLSITRAEVLRFLQRIGPVATLQYPVIKHPPCHLFARCRYERDEDANHAVRALTGAMLGGESVLVWRAKYWMEGNG
ncbi:hypothetical protein PFISCL1PPCAC_21358, partial [Pristionchus fissidentatus]